MIKKFLMWSGKRSHNILVQAGCALLYGLVSMFGFHGAIVIIMKLRKQLRKQNGKKLRKQLRKQNGNLQPTR